MLDEVFFEIGSVDEVRNRRLQIIDRNDPCASSERADTWWQYPNPGDLMLAFNT
jgi:hypothetical protein